MVAHPKFRTRTRSNNPLPQSPLQPSTTIDTTASEPLTPPPPPSPSCLASCLLLVLPISAPPHPNLPPLSHRKCDKRACQSSLAKPRRLIDTRLRTVAASASRDRQSVKRVLVLGQRADEREWRGQRPAVAVAEGTVAQVFSDPLPAGVRGGTEPKGQSNQEMLMSTTVCSQRSTATIAGC